MYDLGLDLQPKTSLIPGPNTGKGKYYDVWHNAYNYYNQFQLINVTSSDNVDFI